jgi:hypothetical protein
MGFLFRSSDLTIAEIETESFLAHEICKPHGCRGGETDYFPSGQVTVQHNQICLDVRYALARRVKETRIQRKEQG